MKNLFVSFTGTLRALKEGSVTESDLDSGLFYFGCTRKHATDPTVENELPWFFKDPDQRRTVHERLIEALNKGESEGRVIWRDEQSRLSYEQLNKLLEANGFTGFSTDENRSTNGSYCYPGVADRVKESNLPLCVIR